MEKLLLVVDGNQQRAMTGQWAERERVWSTQSFIESFSRSGN